ncbi:methyltransferase domain-containing protein [Candidatus Falkowbacteria bacterium]|nr:methyltransferase domain-containing protein [Candidatus Falkowbacteria bacterium]
MEGITKRIGTKLREQRKLKKLSQNDLARNLSVTKAYVSSIESGRRNPSVNVLKKFLDVLEVDPFEFFDRNINDRFQYSDYQEGYIKEILKNHEDWHSEESGFWGEEFLKECQDTISSERSRKEVSIIGRYVKDRSVKILDAPCGYGRISNRLAKKGYRVTGLDSSQFFIDIAKEEADARGFDVEYIKGDILDFSVKESYGAVINIFTSIGYYDTEEANERFLSKLCGFVKPGGVLIIETVNPIGVLSGYRPIEKHITMSGATRVYERFFDVKTSTNVEKTTLYDAAGKAVSKNLHCVRLYYPHELIRICEKNSLRIVDILDSEGRRGSIIGSTRMWLVFEKKK